MKLKLSVDIPKPFTEIIPNLFLGESLAVLNECDLKISRIAAIVNCTTSPKAQFPTVQYFDVKVLDSGDSTTLAFLSESLRPAADFISQQISDGKNVLVHCHRGLSRSPTIICAYLIIYHHMTFAEALNVLKAKRFVNPRPEFKALLKQLELDTRFS